ncbi:AMP-binding protein [Phenylobacterium sp. LjRoot225]|uniref:class I adenylate-forming enzyme family protein n=1 Tax=Phenylobacterium sp. LjRoot225 TaxID=3342285 RepID=UPI003ECD0274
MGGSVSSRALAAAAHAAASVIHGPPLNAQPGLGALTLPGYLREVTSRFAEREAMVVHQTDGQVARWTYADLWSQAVEVARALAACGVGKDSRVGVMMTNRPEWLAAFFGIGLAGGVAVTLSTFSTPAELEQLLQASCVSVLLFEGQVLKKTFAAILAELAPEILTAAPGGLAAPNFPFLRRLVMVGEGAPQGAIETWPQFLARGAAISPALVERTAAATAPADPGVIYFSSGSTGRPKGILSSHRAVALQLWRWVWYTGVDDDVRCLSANGFFWSGNFCQTLGPTLSSGGALILQPTFEPAEALRLMEAERVTMPVGWPHQWARFEEAPNFARTDLSSLRYVDVQTALGRHPTVSTTWVEPKWSYGNTETFTIVTGFPANTPAEVADDTHGQALPGAVIKVVDPLTGEVLPRGQSGEIAVKGVTLMLGYLGVPLDETLDAEGFFRTGDGGRIDDRDRLVWEGRMTDIIKTGGANVSPIEVDAELAACPGVKLSRTVGVPHATLGELVVSCVVLEPGATLDEAAVRDFLRARLASYKTPRRVLFVGDDELSFTGSAKVKTSGLRDLALKRLQAEPNQER